MSEHTYICTCWCVADAAYLWHSSSAFQEEGEIFQATVDTKEVLIIAPGWRFYWEMTRYKQTQYSIFIYIYYIFTHIFI